MKRHRLIIRFLIIWHVFISVFVSLGYYARLENRKLGGDLLGDYSDIIKANPIREYIDWYGFNAYLILIIVVAIVSGICLIVNKTWGRVSSIILGAILLPFGTILFIDNFTFTIVPNPSFIERVFDYFRSMGASLSYIDLICIFYGIFAIIYFSRKNVRSYIELQSVSRAKDINQ